MRGKGQSSRQVDQRVAWHVGRKDRKAARAAARLARKRARADRSAVTFVVGLGASPRQAVAW